MVELAWEITSNLWIWASESGRGCGWGYGPINTALLHWKAFLAPIYSLWT